MPFRQQASVKMSIFWRNRCFREQSREEELASDYEEWIIGTWKQLKFDPLDRYKLPSLPGLYSIYGRFQPGHLNRRIVLRQHTPLSIGEALPNWITEKQRQHEFNACIYVGTSRSLYDRWECHDQRFPIQRFIESGVPVDFYFYAMPPIETGSRESEAERSSRLQLERKLILYLCPILNSPRFWRRGAINMRRSPPGEFHKSSRRKLYFNATITHSPS